MRKLLLVLLLLFGCAQPLAQDAFHPSARPSDDTRVCVVNQSLDTYRIKVRTMFLGSLHPGERRSFVVPGSYTREAVVLRAVPGTGAEELYTWATNLRNSPAWVWTLTMSQITTQTSLSPGEGSCGKTRKAVGG